jgi:hypothetical protein
MRIVRNGIEDVWKKFDALATELNAVAINRIREQYHDAEGLRRAGVLAFQSFLEGSALTNLWGIFASTSLSYVISSSLCKQGRWAEGDILAGVQIWFCAIRNHEEKNAFVTIVQRLWPEASHHLYKVPLHMSEEPLFSPIWDPSPPPALRHQLYHANRKTGDVSNSEATLYNQSAYAGSYENLPAFWAADPFATSGFSPDTSQWLGPATHSTTSQAPNMPIASLRGTRAFTVLFNLFDCLGELPYALSGRGMLNVSPHSLLRYFESRPFRGDILIEDFVRPMLAEGRSKGLFYQAIALVAEEFVILGYLQSTDLIKAFMISLGKVS